MYGNNKGDISYYDNNYHAKYHNSRLDRQNSRNFVPKHDIRHERFLQPPPAAFDHTLHPDQLRTSGYGTHIQENDWSHERKPPMPTSINPILNTNAIHPHKPNLINVKIDHSVSEVNTSEMLRESLAERIRTEKSIVREFLAEFIGTFFLLLIGVSANIQAAASPGGNVISAQLAWGFGFAFAVYLAVNVSGGHLNPAISFAALVTGILSPARLIVYVVAQVLGAFVGTAIAFVGHLDDIQKLDGGRREVFGMKGTAGLLTTFPAEHLTVGGALADQIIGTAILAGVLTMIADKKHRISSSTIPLLAGITMSMIAMTFGANAGFALNPARDFAPRLFALCVGYGWDVFSANNYYFWIPIVGPIVGALVGAFTYKLFVGVHGLSEKIEITGGQPYPRDDRGYKVGPKH